jgi:hypothetical protein
VQFPLGDALNNRKWQNIARRRGARIGATHWSKDQLGLVLPHIGG